MNDKNLPSVGRIEEILGKGAVTSMVPYVRRLTKDPRPTSEIAEAILSTKFTVDNATVGFKTHFLDEEKPGEEAYKTMLEFMGILIVLTKGVTPDLSKTDKQILANKLDYFTNLRDIAEQIGIHDTNIKLNAVDPNAKDASEQRTSLMSQIAEYKGLTESYNSLVENLSIINERLGIGQQPAMSI